MLTDVLWSLMPIVCVAALCGCVSASTGAQMPESTAQGLASRLELPQGGQSRIGGFVGARIRAAERSWLIPAREANPAMFDMFRARDRLPQRDLLPWSGEFAGKHLTAAVLVWSLSRSPALRAEIDRLVDGFVLAQSPEGYLGPFAKSERLRRGWDLWGHYHAIVGLVLAYQKTGNANALDIARRAADYICESFPEGGRRIVAAPPDDRGQDLEMNQAIIHGMLLLYRVTGEKQYLALAQRIEQDWQSPPSGDYVRQALAGVPFHQTPKPRWESLHDLQAIAELHWVTGEPAYRRAFEQLWWSICESDRHNTGGFSSGEQACGDPYRLDPIETCCTVAWIALSVDMLRLTGESIVADEIELTTLNGGIGGQHPSGRWWTYNTPMDGERKASAHDISFQCRPGSPELNCCSVNGPRILGMIGQWALMEAADGPALNYYGPSELAARTPSGQVVTFHQQTQYPRSGRIVIQLRASETERFVLRLRIPHWSQQTTLVVDNDRVAATPGTYVSLDREWRDGDRVTLTLDMSPHFWVGEQECAAKASVYRGPILLAFDPRFNDADSPPALAAASLRSAPVAWTDAPWPWLLLKATDRAGSSVVLCDFASAGATGTRYQSWLPVTGVGEEPFSRSNPLRSTRP